MKRKIGSIFLFLAAFAVFGVYLTLLINFHQHKICNKALINEAFPLIKPKTKEQSVYFIKKSNPVNKNLNPGIASEREQTDIYFNALLGYITDNYIDSEFEIKVTSNCHLRAPPAHPFA